MNKTTALIGLTTALLICLPAWAHEGPDSGCETRLEQGAGFENLVEEAVGLESSLLSLENLCYGKRCLREAQVLRAEFNNYIEDLLGRVFETTELVRRFAELSAREARLRMQLGPKPAAPAPKRTLLTYLEDPSALSEGEPVELGNERNFIRSVTFADGILFQFWELALHMQTKFLRSIFTGLVGPVGESGIKPLNDISKYLVEVKTYGGGARLIGCLKGGNLTILRLVPDHVHHKGSLSKFAALCN